MNKDTTLEEYLNNSGTRGTQPIYETRGVRFEKVVFRKLENGLYQKEFIENGGDW